MAHNLPITRRAENEEWKTRRSPGGRRKAEDGGRAHGHTVRGSQNPLGRHVCGRGGGGAQNSHRQPAGDWAAEFTRWSTARHTDGRFVPPLAVGTARQICATMKRLFEFSGAAERSPGYILRKEDVYAFAKDLGEKARCPKYISDQVQRAPLAK